MARCDMLPTILLYLNNRIVGKRPAEPMSHVFPISQLWRYPVKGLPGQLVTTANLEASAHFPGDRKYAIGAGDEKVNDGIWIKKAYFLQIMSHEALAGIDCDFDTEENRERIILSRNGKLLLNADIQSGEGRRAVATFFDQLFDGQLRGPTKLVSLEDGAFTDTQEPLISLGGSASIEGFAKLTGTISDQRRFRLNIIVETTTPFEEAALIGKTIGVGDVRLDVIGPVGRCAAIDVNPQTAERGPPSLTMMKKTFGHTNLGIFALVAHGGTITQGDNFTVLP